MDVSNPGFMGLQTAGGGEYHLLMVRVEGKEGKRVLHRWWPKPISKGEKPGEKTGKGGRSSG